MKQAIKAIVERAIEVHEVSQSVIGKEEPIRWKLHTTHVIKCFEDPFECINWYRKRWQMEQLFRMMKKQGMNIESSQVETLEGLSKLASMAMCASVRGM